MKKTFALVIAAFFATLAAAVAQEGGHMGHMGMSHAPDARKAVELPAPMRDHMRANMREHFNTLSEILTALSAGDGANAAKIANDRLSLASPGAAACKPDAASSGKMGDQASMMAAMMAKNMPDDMRALGFAMHEQASKFADVAGKIKAGDDVKPALAELAKVTQACGACHAAYRLQ